MRMVSTGGAPAIGGGIEGIVAVVVLLVIVVGVMVWKNVI